MSGSPPGSELPGSASLAIAPAGALLALVALVALAAGALVALATLTAGALVALGAGADSAPVRPRSSRAGCLGEHDVVVHSTS